MVIHRLCDRAWTSAKVGARRRQVARLEHEANVLEMPLVKPLVKPRNLGELVERAFRAEHRADGLKK